MDSSALNLRLHVCHFPKHRDELWEDIVLEDRPYVEWLISGDPEFELDEELYNYLTDLLEE